MKLTVLAGQTRCVTMLRQTLHHLRYPLLFGLAVCLALYTPAAGLAQSGSFQVQDLLAQLENGAPLEQEQAAQQLASMPSATLVPEVTRIFRSAANPRPAATVLAAIGTPAALAVLVNGLQDEELTARRNAAQLMLLEKGVGSVTALGVGLQSRNPMIRQHAAQVLGFIGSARGINVLVRVAQEDNVAQVRQEAVWALGEIGEARVRLTLKAIARTDPDPNVRIEAERAVLRAGGEL